MNKSDMFDNRKTYLIDVVTHVVFTPGFDDYKEAFEKALEVNDMPTPPTRLPLHVGVVGGLPINKAGYKSTLPLTTLIADRRKALKK